MSKDTPTVVIDGEPVVFEGTQPPSTAQALIELIGKALSEQGRVLTRLTVDGINVFETALSEDAPYSRIEGCSLPQDVFLLNQAREHEKQLPSIAEDANGLLKSLLSQPWDISIQRAQEFIKELSPVVEVLEACHQFTKTSHEVVSLALGKLLREIEPLLDSYSQCIEKTDPGLLAEQILTAWLPWTENVRQCLSNTVIPQLDTPS